MSDGRPKPAIPAWQRNAQTKPPPATEDPVSSQPEEAQSEPVEDLKEVEVEGQPSADEEPESVPSSDTSPTTAPAAEAIVEEKKPSAFAAGNFESFTQRQQPVRQTQAPVVQQQVPPIITYPEFMVEAHKPPPLITPGRILNIIYAAGTAAALVYGASKLVVNPMLDSLSSARHDYFNHTQSKVEDFNERLSKIVSKVPDAKKTGITASTEGDEIESVTSDPTELYHRDIGTQTADLPLRPSTAPDADKKDAVTYQTGALEIMKEHINEITAGIERNAMASKSRQEKMDKLRHYLDGLVYGSHSLSTWQTNEDGMTVKKESNSEDPIEDLKKEIRAVKGVLLSAKRFPSVNRQVAGAV